MSFAERRRALLSQGGGIKADPVLAKNDWETISKVAQAGKAADFWKVGDRKLITLKSSVANPYLQPFTNFQIYATIIGINHNESIEGKGIHFQLGDAAGAPYVINVAFVDSNYSKTGSSTGFRMNTSGTNTGGWKDSYMRKTFCPLFFNQLLPDDLKAVIQPCVKYTHRSGVFYDTLEEQLWLLSEYEIFGKTKYSMGGDANKQKQYDYYKNLIASGKKPYRYKHNATTYQAGWWLRSPYSNNTTSFCCILTDPGGGSSGGYSANYSFGFSPCFKV